MPTTTSDHDRPCDTAVVGAGIGGLLAAATAAAGGDRVVVIEPRSPGGRARADDRHGFRFNRGPRALYRHGPAEAALQAAGVDVAAGHRPTMIGAAALSDGELHRFPGSVGDVVRTTLMSTRDKGRLSAVVARAVARGPKAAPHVSVSAWLDQTGTHGRPRQSVEALVRLATYVDDPGQLAAAPAFAAVRSATTAGVRYLDGGWQQVVDRLVAHAQERGVEFLAAEAQGVQPGADGHLEVSTTDGSLSANTVIVATGGPGSAGRLVGGENLILPEQLVAARAACLELGLHRPPRRRFVLGIDEPLYLSTHAPPARLAPEGGAVVHVVRYRSAGDEQPASEVHDRLRRLAAQAGISPGDVATERFLASMPVCGAIPTATAGGLQGRPAIDGTRVDGVLLVGDWVGPRGLLLDAVAASALAAGRRAALRSTTMVPR